MEQSFEALFESSLQELNVGDVVKGTIVRCLVSSIDGGALRYQSGIAFRKRLDHSPVEEPPLR